ncbi:MAG: endoplasmic reticulum-based factor for assembly of V-ATPase-domain-containing protein [Benjaminiella poitrasii]|nr:MAG: endoplasmic reticulum-based factor for assembly of V-ATPase-domain-containing protein [Benjaminiella poitrasii]
MDLQLTQSIQESIKSALKKTDFPIKYKEEAEKLRDLKLDSTEKHPVSVDLVEQVSKSLDIHFHELIIGSGLYFPPKEIRKQDPKFVAYMEKLRAEQQEREYNNMVAAVVSSEDQKFNLGIKPNELKEINSHIATIFNILFSMIAVYVAVYKVSKSIVDDFGMQILFGLGGAFSIGVVEVFLYVKYASTASSEKKKTSKKKKQAITSF